MLKPSAFSVTASALVAIATLTIANWSYITKSVFYTYFFDNTGLTAALNGQLDNLTELAVALSQQRFSYEIVVLAAASAVGLTVYVILQSVQRLLARALEDYLEVDEANQVRKSSAITDVSAQWTVRIASVVSLVIYSVLFIDYVLSFGILLSIAGIDEILNPEGSFYNALAVVVLVAGLHPFVILVRFMILRPRLFGGRAAISAALYDTP